MQIGDFAKMRPGRESQKKTGISQKAEKQKKRRKKPCKQESLLLLYSSISHGNRLSPCG
jgi:hypothetical protein